MAVCLVTGGAGFIGSHLVDALVARGHEVRVLDDFSSGSWENLEAVHDRVRVIEGDLTRPEDVRRATEGAELVFHHGALASVPRSVADPLSTHETCATGTLHVLQAAREAGVKRLIYAASSSAYGNSSAPIKREDDPLCPLSPYAVAKLTGEQYCAAFTEVYGLETVRLRYFNVFGRRQPPDSPYSAVIPLFVTAMLTGRSPVVYGDGTQARDFTPVENVVQANLLAAEAPGAPGKVYNVACGASVSLLELIATLNGILGTHIQPVHTAPRPGDVRDSRADISRARAELGYSPQLGWDEGLRNCIGYYADLVQCRRTPRVAEVARAR
jgi:UDP-glucose 4-epimerase